MHLFSPFPILSLPYHVYSSNVHISFGLSGPDGGGGWGVFPQAFQVIGPTLPCGRHYSSLTGWTSSRWTDRCPRWPRGSDVWGWWGSCLGQRTSEHTGLPCEAVGMGIRAIYLYLCEAWRSGKWGVKFISGTDHLNLVLRAVH